MQNAILQQILGAGGIAGAIALIIAGAIAVRYVLHGPEPIPEVLTYALTTILGFYFGAGVGGALKQAAPPT